MKRLLLITVALMTVLGCLPAMANTVTTQELVPNLQIIFEPTRTVVERGKEYEYTASFTNYNTHPRKISSMEITVRMTDGFIDIVDGDSSVNLIDSAYGEGSFEYSEKTRILKYKFTAKNGYLDKSVVNIFSLKLKIGEQFEEDRTVIIDTTATVLDDSEKKEKINTTCFRFELNGIKSLNVVGPDSFYKSDAPNARPGAEVVVPAKSSTPQSASSTSEPASSSTHVSDSPHVTAVYIAIAVVLILAAAILVTVILLRKKNRS